MSIRLIGCTKQNKYYTYKLLTIIIVLITYNYNALAYLANQYKLNKFIHNKPILNNNIINNIPIYIYANKVHFLYPKQLIFSGDVKIKWNDSIIDADQVQLYQRSYLENKSAIIINACNNVFYNSSIIMLKSTNIWLDINNKDIDIYMGDYQLVEYQGRGKADEIKQRKDNRYILLKNGSFTSCAVGDNSWNIVGSKILYDRQEQIAKIWNAHFKINKITIFYFPYMQLSIGNKNCSGFLFPKIQYGRNNGIELSIPYYLNIAPNFNITIKPICGNKCSIKLKTEARYFTKVGQGLITFDWLPKYHTDLNNYGKQNNLWLIYWNHEGIYGQHWYFNIDCAKTNNHDYFKNLNSKHYNFIKDDITQKFIIGYINKNWDISFFYKELQSIIINRPIVYNSASQLNLIYYKNNIKPFEFRLFSKVTNYNNTDFNNPTILNVHIEPIINFPIITRWFIFNTEAKVITDHCRQENIYNHIDDSAKITNRITPQFKIDTKIIFERNTHSGYIQTIEPSLQYSYIPCDNQNNIDLYEHAVFKSNNYSLYNQINIGLTTHIYNNNYVEKFNLFIGHTYHFSKYRKNKINDYYHDNVNRTTFVINSCYNINNNWVAYLNLRYNYILKRIIFDDLVIEHHGKNNNILKLSYRYVNLQYIRYFLPEINNINYFNNTSQIGITSNWLVTNNLSLSGSCYFNTKTNQITENLISFQYKTCCWSINIGYEREINKYKNISNLNQHDNKIWFIIKLLGLNKNYD